MPISQPVSGPETRYGRRVLGDAEFEKQQANKKRVGSDGVVYGDRIMGSGKAAKTKAAKPAESAPFADDAPDFLTDAESSGAETSAETVGREAEPILAGEPVAASPIPPTAETWNQFWVRRVRHEGASMQDAAAEWKQIKAQRITQVHSAADSAPSD